MNCLIVMKVTAMIDSGSRVGREHNLKQLLQRASVTVFLRQKNSHTLKLQSQPLTQICFWRRDGLLLAWPSKTKLSSFAMIKAFLPDIRPPLRAPSSTPTPKTPQTRTMVWVFPPQKLRPWSEFLLSPMNTESGLVWVLVRVFLGPWSEFPPARAETLG